MDVQTHYFWPLKSTNTKEYENMWNKIVEESGGRVTSQTLPVMFGRYQTTDRTKPIENKSIQ